MTKITSVLRLSLFTGTLGLASALAQAQENPGGQSSDFVLTQPQREVMILEELIRDYILNHPEIIIESLTRYEEKLAEEERLQQQQALKDSLAELHYDEDSPVLGNPDGDVVIVEFFDYRCPYCKRVTPAIEELLAEDPNLRVVMKEWPILSQESRFAARAALAADKQGLYQELHFELMTMDGELSELGIYAAAERVGLDVEKLVEDMEAPEINAELDQVYQLARRIGATGTPAFVIGDQFYGGAISIQTMRQAIELAREKQG